MIEVLKQALEALTINSDRVTEIGKQREAITSLRQAIKELESQEPFAYVNVEMRRLEFATDYVKWDTPTTIKLDKIPLYTHPPQRTWVGLTDAEFREIYETYPIVEEDPWDYERAIELKLKEFNT